MIATVHLIALDEATADQINGVHELIKQHARGWWHHFDNCWIVGGSKTASEWRDVIEPAIQTGRASALILRLPDTDAERDWSYFGVNADKRLDWIERNYDKPPKPAG